MSINEGISEVPNHLDVPTRRFLTQIRNAILKGQESRTPPTNPSNVKVTPIGGGNIIQFSRGSDADNTILYIGTTADFGSAVPVPLGLAVQYTDNVGQGGVTKWYWLKSMRGLLQAPAAVGGYSGATLALGTGVSVPAPPPPSDVPVVDGKTGKTVAGVRRYGGNEAL